MDEHLRSLERRSENGDLQAQIEYVQYLLRLNRLQAAWDESQNRANDARIPPIQELFNRLPDSLWYGYAQAILTFHGNGVPFRFLGFGRCNCENMACVNDPPNRGDHPQTRCPVCEGPIRIEHGANFPISRYCQNMDCEYYEQERELSVSGCDQLAWRGYEDMLGGLCDTCMPRMSRQYHGPRCSCQQCGGKGPLISVYAPIMTSLELHQTGGRMRLHDYAEAAGLNSYLRNLGWDAGFGSWSLHELDDPMVVYIEVRPQGIYRLKTQLQENEVKISIEMRDLIIRRQNSAVYPFLHAAVLGRDFRLVDLTRHLVQQMTGSMHDLFQTVVTRFEESRSGMNLIPIYFPTIDFEPTAAHLSFEARYGSEMLKFQIERIPGEDLLRIELHRATQNVRIVNDGFRRSRLFGNEPITATEIMDDLDDDDLIG